MLTRILFAAFLVSAFAPNRVFAQDIIHYKFDSGAGGKVVKYADDEPLVPREGRIIAPTGLTVDQAWGPGRFGGGLAAAPFIPNVGYVVDSGWDDHIGMSDLTMACFVRAIHPIVVNTNENVRIAGPDLSNANLSGIGFGLITLPSQSNFVFGDLRFTWRGTFSNLQVTYSGQNVAALANAGWVHVAVVLKRSGPTPYIRFYVNGVGLTPQPINPSDYTYMPPQCYGFGSTCEGFKIGIETSGRLAIDEFRLSLREASPVEIAQWAAVDLAAAAPFGDACHPFGIPVLLWGTGGLPQLGNAAHTLTVYGLPTSAVTLGIGFSNTNIAGTPLPLDLAPFAPTLAGCLLQTSADLIQTGAIGPTGSLPFPVPIPPVAWLSGLSIYAQAILYSPPLASNSITNAWAMSIGL